MSDVAQVRMLTPIAETGSDAFSRFTDVVQEIDRFAEVVVKAARSLMATAPKLGELIVEYEEAKANPESKAAAEYWKRERHLQDATFLKGAATDGFPLVYSQAAVSVWGRLEAHMEDVCVLLLSMDRSLLACEALEKVSLAKYERQPESERGEYVLLQLQNQLTSKLKDGHVQFESVLRALGFGGDIPDVTKKTLIEFGTVRNVVVHKRNVVDKLALERCPWLGIKLGDEIRVTEHMFDRYVLATFVYAALVQQRLHERYDGQPFPPLAKLIGSFQRALEDLTAGRSHPGYVRLT